MNAVVHICKCCEYATLAVNAHGLCTACTVCLHCEKNPALTELGLCRKCDRMPRVRCVYERRQNWTPEWEQHLRFLSAFYRNEMKRLKLKECHEIGK